MRYKNHKQYRLPGYDYSSVGDYFITVCTKDRLHHFGKIFNAKEDAFIELTPIGSFVKDSMLSIPGIFKNVELGETVVMPNHIHLIITICYQDVIPPISKQSSLQKLMAPNNGLQPLVPGSVSSIINHFKGKVKNGVTLMGMLILNGRQGFMTI